MAKGPEIIENSPQYPVVNLNDRRLEFDGGITTDFALSRLERELQRIVREAETAGQPRRGVIQRVKGIFHR